MPLVRISHAAGKSGEDKARISESVHNAMIETFGVPADDYFQIVTEHEPGTGIIGPENFLGIGHSPDFLFVQITCAEGRSVEQKQKLYEAIARNVAARGIARPADVIINLVETKRENWSFGNGIAQFA